MMKKLIIGRNNACDIVIPDTSDLVSRKQAVLAVSFWGKMVLYDTSGNGTYINGQKLEHGKGQRVTRKDKINFARTHDFDWNNVKDPWHREKIFVLAAIVVIIVLSALTVLFVSLHDDSEPSKPKTEEVHGIDNPTKKTITTVNEKQTEVVSVSKKSYPIRHKRGTSHSKKPVPDNKLQQKHIKEGRITEDMINKEVNDKSPIVY